MLMFMMISVGGDVGEGARLADEGVPKSFPLMLCRVQWSERMMKC